MKWNASRLIAFTLLLARPCLGVQLGEGKGTLDVRKGFRVTEVRVFGNEEAFSRQGTGRSSPEEDEVKVEQSLHVNVDMEVVPRLSVRGAFDDVSYPAKKSLAVNYEGDNLNVTAGDISVGFSGLEYPMQSQSVFGVRANYQDEDDTASLFAARMSNAVGHHEVQGDNTVGPFFLPDRKIVENSERIYVDGQRQFRQTQYTIDYSTGVIQFTNPVDDRHRISIDYEFESLFSLNVEKLIAGQYRRIVGNQGNLGIAVGTRQGGGAEQRRLMAIDGQLALPGGGSVGGEIAGYQRETDISTAVRAEVSGTVAGVGLRGSLRRVAPTFEGLGAVPPRNNLLEGDVSASWAPSRQMSVSSRFYGTMDNLDQDPQTSINRKLVQESNARVAFTRSSRLELTISNRNEIGLTSLGEADPELSSRGHSVRVGGRYRIDQHLLSSSYEIRKDRIDVQTDNPYWQDRHTVNGEARSRLGQNLYGSTSLSLALTPLSDGEARKDLTNAWNLTTKIFSIDTNLNYTLQRTFAEGAPVSHSGGLTLRTRAGQNISANASFRIKGTVPEDGEFIGDSTVSGGLTWQPLPTMSLISTFEQRLSQGHTIGPRVLDFRGSWQATSAIHMNSGVRFEFFDPGSETDAYVSRVAFMEATANF